MTDFTNTIERTVESVEDLQTDLEAQIADILGVDVTTVDSRVETHPDRNWEDAFCVNVELDGLEEELGNRLDAEIASKDLKVYAHPAEGDD